MDPLVSQGLCSMDFVSRFVYTHINAMNSCASAQFSKEFGQYEGQSNTRLTWCHTTTTAISDYLHTIKIQFAILFLQKLLKCVYLYFTEIKVLVHTGLLVPSTDSDEILLTEATSHINDKCHCVYKEYHVHCLLSNTIPPHTD
jgi:hypothetical protein